MKTKSGGCGGCLGAPVRALSRACDSACDLYMRGMSGCARRVPSGTSAGVVGRGFGGAGAATLRLRVVSSDGADGSDLVRAAAAAKRHQRRVAAEPHPAAEAAGGVRLIGVARGAGGAAERPIGFVHLKVTPSTSLSPSLSDSSIFALPTPIVPPFAMISLPLFRATAHSYPAFPKTI